MALLSIGAAPVGALSPSGGIASFHHDRDGYLGVVFENLTSEQRAKLHLGPKDGVMIAAVDHDAPAGKAGLRSNDVILQMDGKPAQHAEDLRETLHKASPGESVALEVVRNGRPMHFHIVLADRKTVEQQAWSQHYTVPQPQQRSATGELAQIDPPSAVQSGGPQGTVPASASATRSRQVSTTSRATGQTGILGAVPSEIGKTFSTNGGLMSLIPGTPPYTGITVDVLTPQLANFFGVKGTTALLVKSVDPNSPGSRAGLQAGDVIYKANDAPMTTRGKWSHVLRENRHEAIKLQILRNRQSMVLLLTLSASKS